MTCQVHVTKKKHASIFSIFVNFTFSHTTLCTDHMLHHMGVSSRSLRMSKGWAEGDLHDELGLQSVYIYVYYMIHYLYMSVRDLGR